MEVMANEPVGVAVDPSISFRQRCNILDRLLKNRLDKIVAQQLIPTLLCALGDMVIKNHQLEDLLTIQRSKATGKTEINRLLVPTQRQPQQNRKQNQDMAKWLEDSSTSCGSSDASLSPVVRRPKRGWKMRCAPYYPPSYQESTRLQTSSAASNIRPSSDDSTRRRSRPQPPPARWSRAAPAPAAAAAAPPKLADISPANSYSCLVFTAPPLAAEAAAAAAAERSSSGGSGGADRFRRSERLHRPKVYSSVEEDLGRLGGGGGTGGGRAGAAPPDAGEYGVLQQHHQKQIHVDNTEGIPSLAFEGAAPSQKGEPVAADGNAGGYQKANKRATPAAPSLESAMGWGEALLLAMGGLEETTPEIEAKKALEKASDDEQDEDSDTSSLQGKMDISSAGKVQPNEQLITPLGWGEELLLSLAGLKTSPMESRPMNLQRISQSQSRHMYGSEGSRHAAPSHDGSADSRKETADNGKQRTKSIHPPSSPDSSASGYNPYLFGALKVKKKKYHPAEDGYQSYVDEVVDSDAYSDDDAFLSRMIA